MTKYGRDLGNGGAPPKWGSTFPLLKDLLDHSKNNFWVDDIFVLGFEKWLEILYPAGFIGHSKMRYKLVSEVLFMWILVPEFFFRQNSQKSNCDIFGAKIQSLLEIMHQKYFIKANIFQEEY